MVSKSRAGITSLTSQNDPFLLKTAPNYAQKRVKNRDLIKNSHFYHISVYAELSSQTPENGLFRPFWRKLRVYRL